MVPAWACCLVRLVPRIRIMPLRLQTMTRVMTIGDDPPVGMGPAVGMAGTARAVRMGPVAGMARAVRMAVDMKAVVTYAETPCGSIQ